MLFPTLLIAQGSTLAVTSDFVPTPSNQYGKANKTGHPRIHLVLPLLWVKMVFTTLCIEL